MLNQIILPEIVFFPGITLSQINFESETYIFDFESETYFFDFESETYLLNFPSSHANLLLLLLP